MKFTIRDLLLVTVIVALAVGWALDHHQQVSKAKIREQLQRENFKTIFEHRDANQIDFDADGRVRIPNSLPNPQAPAARLPKK